MTSAELRDVFSAASERAAPVRIIYHGGNRPGSIRDVRPLWVTSDAIRAFDIAAGIEKTFLLAKIDIAAAGAAVTMAADDPQSIGEAITPRMRELQELGWHVALTRDMATLHGYLKNGKPRKAASVSLDFSEFTGIGVIDLDDDGKPVQREESWKSRAPYHVSSAALPTRSFAYLWKAAALFLEEARKLSMHKSQPSAGSP